MLDLRDELLCVVRIEAQNFAQAFEADVLQVTVGQGLHAGVGLNHFLLGQTVRANQVAPTWKVEMQVVVEAEGKESVLSVSSTSVGSQHRLYIRMRYKEKVRAP